MSGSKKNILLTCLILILNNNSFAQFSACANVELGPDTILTCTSSCITLEAEVTEVGITNSYSVSSINYAPPFPFNQGNPILVGYDDIWSEIIPLPFTFCFFGNIYDKIVIGANGVITLTLLLLVHLDLIFLQPHNVIGLFLNLYPIQQVFPIEIQLTELIMILIQCFLVILL